jgi:hypothetical protein
MGPLSSARLAELRSKLDEALTRVERLRAQIAEIEADPAKWEREEEARKVDEAHWDPAPQRQARESLAQAIERARRKRG